MGGRSGLQLNNSSEETPAAFFFFEVFDNKKRFVLWAGKNCICFWFGKLQKTRSGVEAVCRGVMFETNSREDSPLKKVL